jgi:hypothetical protein
MRPPWNYAPRLLAGSIPVFGSERLKAACDTLSLSARQLPTEASYPQGGC